MSLLYELKLRRGRPSKLDSKLVGLTPAAREQLQRAAGKRDQAIQALNSCQGVGNKFDDAINGISSYLPVATAIAKEATDAEWLNASSFEFSWGTGINQGKISNNKKDKDFHAFHDVRDDLANLHSTLATLHYKKAKELLASLPEHNEHESAAAKEKRSTGTPQGVKLLRLAAALFHSTPCTDYQVEPMPIDAVRGTCLGMKEMCLCNIQELMIQGAVEKKSSAGLIAKLSKGVADKYSEIRKLLGTSLKHQFHELEMTWNYYLKGKSDMYLGLSRSYQGIDANDRGAYGEAVTLFGHANIIWGRAMVPQTQDGALEAVRHGIQFHIQANLERYHESKRDNDKIYFMSVPPIEDIPEATGFASEKNFHIHHIFSTSLPVIIGAFVAKPLDPEPSPASTITGPFLVINKATTPAPAIASATSSLSSPASSSNTPSPSNLPVGPNGERNYSCAYCTAHFMVTKYVPNCKATCPTCEQTNMIA